jgi:hypothetical protein
MGLSYLEFVSSFSLKKHFLSKAESSATAFLTIKGFFVELKGN